MASRATASAAELSAEELTAGGRGLLAKIKKYKPHIVAILGIGAYRAAFGRSKATFGKQLETLENVPLWVLPNPSGLNATYQMPDLTRIYRKLQNAAKKS